MAVAAPELRSLFFEPGRRVRLQPLGTERVYQCLVEEVPNGTVYLTMPMDGCEYAKIPAGQRIQMGVERRGNLYLFESVVTGRRFGDHPMLVVKRPPDHTAAQRRKHVRVPILLDGSLWRTESDGDRSPYRIPITIVDVSAGGLGFSTKENLLLGSEVELEFVLPHDRGHQEGQGHAPIVSVYANRWHQHRHRATTVQRHANGTPEATTGTALAVDARVVHCASQSDEPERDEHGRRIPRVYRAGVEFLAVGDIVRERIIRFVVRRELELRRKGML